jgi:hypothetical protein
MPLSTILRITWTLLIFCSFPCSFTFHYFVVFSAISAFRILFISIFFRAFTVFEQNLTRQHYFLLHHHYNTILYHRLQTRRCQALQNSFGYPCPNNRVQTVIGIRRFPMKTSLQKIYTSKVPEHWFNCIHNTS